MENINRKKSFKDEMQKSFILYTLIPTLILSFISYAGLLFYSFKVLEKSNIEKNEQISILFEDNFNLYIKEMNELANSDKLKKLFLYGNEKNNHNIWIYEQLYKFINRRDIKSVFYIIDNKGNVLETSAWKNSNYSPEDIKELGILSDNYSNENIKLFFNKRSSNQNTRRIYSLSKRVVDGRGKIIGYILFDLLDNDLNKIIYKNKSDIFIVTDIYQNSIITTNNLVLDSLGRFEPQENKTGYIQIDDKKYFMSRKKIVNNNISVYSLSSIELFGKFYVKGLLFLLIVFFVLTITTVIMAKKFAITRTKYIYQLINSIKKVKEGNFDTRVNIQSNDEFETLGNYYNEMTTQLTDLIEKNREQLKINKIAELKQLEAQFNPHFLFNTLETLKYMIKMDSEAAVRIVLSMANLLRYSINYEIEKIKLIDDIKYIEDYLLIQKFKFSKRMDYSIEVEPEAANLIVPKLIIQPIVENCFKYGFENKAYIKIKLKCFVEDSNLILKVIDSGSGIDKEDIDKLMKKLESDCNLSNNLGLYNVHKRIRILYGDSYGLDIKSIKSIKTEVTIKLPKIEVNE